MFALRSLVSAALLSSAWAEAYVEADAFALLQAKQQRHKPKRNASDGLPVDLMAHATGATDTTPMHELALNLMARATNVADTVLNSNKDENCDMDRTMKSKGPKMFEDKEGNPTPQTSIVTGNEYRFASEDEFAVLDKINEVRRAGFSCTDRNTGKVDVFKPKCRNEDLIFDCRLWFAAKQHSEDMGKRDYYSHETQYPFPSKKDYGKDKEGNPKLEPFNKRAKAYAMNVVAHKEVLMGASGDQDTPEVIVQSWLDSYGHCMALGTTNAQVAGVGRAPCTTEDGRCSFSIGNFTGALFQQRGFLFWGTGWNLDTTCYPDSRNRENR